MTTLYGRSFLLEVGNKEETLYIDSLRIKFKINRGNVKSPDTATFEIYNLNISHRQLIMRSFNQVRFSAGYGELGLIYLGEILYATLDGDNEGNIILKITAGDGATDYSKASVALAFAAGVDDKDIVQQCLANMENTNGLNIDKLSSVKLPRGSVMLGRCRKYLSLAAANQGRSWSIYNNTLRMLEYSSIPVGMIVKLSEDSGMLKTPQRTKDGVIVHCLINPAIQLGSHIALQSSVNPDVDGELKVIYNEIDGDTLGDAWTMKLTCVNGKFSPMNPEKFIYKKEVKKKKGKIRGQRN